MIFDWDDRKEAANIKKHGVDFWEAQTVFYDPLAQQYADSHPNGDRFIIIGESAKERALLVVFVEKKEGEIRILRSNAYRKRKGTV